MNRINSEDKRRLRAKLHQQAGGRCEYCRCSLPLAEGTVDHYVPQARGGTNAQRNLRWSCIGCNRSKGDRMPADWTPAATQMTPRQRMLAQAMQNYRRAQC